MNNSVENRKIETYIIGLNIGEIAFSIYQDCLVEISFEHQIFNSEIEGEIAHSVYDQILQYLGGSRKHFDLKYTIHGSQFFLNVIDQIKAIPYGETRTYKDIATAIGSPKAYRAVGTACKHNPLPILIPCHRVIKSSGEYGEYVGGTDLKTQLIRLENIYKSN